MVLLNGEVDANDALKDAGLVVSKVMAIDEIGELVLSLLKSTFEALTHWPVAQSELAGV